MAFFAEFLGTLSGFGSSTFFVPLALSFESMHFVLALTSILHCFSNISKLFLFKQTQWPKYLILWIAVSFIFTGVGAVLNSFLKILILKKAMGLFLMCYCLGKLFCKTWFLQKTTSLSKSLIWLSISGFLTGFIGTGGALRGMALSMLNVEKTLFVFLSASIDFGGDLLRASIYLSNGYMDWDQWYYLPFLFFAGFLGSWLGRKMINYVSKELFEKIVLIFIGLSGVLLIL